MVLLGFLMKCAQLAIELKVEYNEICQRKEDLKTQYRDANKHHNDLSKACSDEAVFIKERLGRLKQRLQATDATITQMRQKFNHLDAMVKANADAAAANGMGDGNVQVGGSIIGIDGKLASKLNGSGEAEQELQRYIAGINHTQTHRANLDAERRKVEAQLEMQGKQPEVFEARHKLRVGIMTSICEQFDYMLKVVHQHMVQLDKLRKAAAVDAEKD
jgi:chromosome segregation ATPase